MEDRDGRVNQWPFGDRARFRTEIVILRSARSHLIIHVYASSTEGPGDRPVLRRPREIEAEIAI